MNRKYFRSSIDELENLFENQRDDGSALVALKDELEHRKTERAAKLRRRVETRLAQLEISNSTPTLEQPSLQFGSVQANECNSIVQPAGDILMSAQESTNNSDSINPTLHARFNKHGRDKTPTITNEPESILSAWTALEVLSPPLPFRC